MRKNRYLPQSDPDREIWLNNFATKFSKVAPDLGLPAAEVTSALNDAAMFSFLIGRVEAHSTAKEQWVSYKNLIKKGPPGKPGGNIPAALPATTPPTAVTPGIFPRIAKLVQRIKASANYTEAIGKDLGIIGSTKSVDTAEMKPVLKLVLKGGQVEVQWTKGTADAIYIETDKGSGAWQFLAIDAVPHYTDVTPIVAAATWRYRAMFLISDERVGQWSSEVSIAVG